MSTDTRANAAEPVVDYAEVLKTYDPVIGVEWGRQARELLEGTGANVLYREYPLPHAIDPAYLDTLAQWVRARV